MRYALSDSEWGTIQPILPTKSRGVPRVDDRRVLNGIFWVLRSGAPWRDLPDCYGPYTTCYRSWPQSVSGCAFMSPRPSFMSPKCLYFSEVSLFL
jgi:transposase